MKKLLALVMACAVLLCLFSGCSTQSGGEPSPSPSASNEPAASPSEAAPDDTSAEPESTTQVITDMAGREVTIPSEIKSVYCAVPTGEAMVATLCPDKLIGWVNTPSEVSLEYLPERLANLRVIGGWMGQKVTAHMEDIISLAPDVVIYMGAEVTTNLSDVPEQIHEQTGIPVIVVPEEFQYTAEVYRFLGECLDEPERGEKLATYCEEKMAEIQEAMSAVPEDEKVSAYYAEGTGGLATDPSGSHHVEVLDFIGVNNVADVEMLAGMGMTEVTIEQIINWNPDVILVSGMTSGNYNEILTNPIWQNIKAVQDGRIYCTPTAPFNWFDRPPNIMRVLGIQWFASVIYSDYVSYDINSEIKDFYSLFYNVDLTDDQIAALLATPETA